MIELFLVCVLAKPTTPCPPPPPPPTEQPVGLPAKKVELIDDDSKNPEGLPKSSNQTVAKPVFKLPMTNRKSNNYNRRGNRNH